MPKEKPCAEKLAIANKKLWHDKWEFEYIQKDSLLIAKILEVIKDYHSGDMSERASDLISDLHEVLFKELWEHHCYVSGAHREWALKLIKERSPNKKVSL